MENFEAIKAYTHWLFNADSEFVMKIWGESNPHMADHFQTKLKGLIRIHGEGYYMSTQVLAHFDRELSDNYRADLYKYIIDNHSNKW